MKDEIYNAAQTISFQPKNNFYAKTYTNFCMLKLNLYYPNFFINSYNNFHLLKSCQLFSKKYVFNFFF